MSSNFSTVDLGARQWKNIQHFTNDRLNRELDCSGGLEGLIKDCSTLAEHVSEAGTLLSIAITCDTEDPGKRQAYLDFIENVQPKLSEFADAFNRRLAGHPAVDELPLRYDLMIKCIRTDIGILREENIPLQLEEAKLETEHSTITGAMMVEYDGEGKTLPQMAV